VASQTPETNAPFRGRNDYLAGWAAMSRLLEQGASWSGHERNVVFLNRGNTQFADVSAASGGDFDDDGRVVVPIDLDFDGDPDLILRNRTSPSLRILRNDAGAGSHWIAIRPRATTTNRSCVGTTVTVYSRGRAIVRTLRAGEGYLAQSGAWIQFGLGDSDNIDRISVRFVGGELVEYGAQAVDRHYDLIEGKGLVEVQVPKSFALIDGALEASASPRSGRILLRTTMSIPPTIREKLKPLPATDGRPVLLNLYSRTCVPCMREWGEWGKERELFLESGVHVVALLADQGEDELKKSLEKWRELACGETPNGPFHHLQADEDILKTLGVLIQHITGKDAASLPLPTSVLLGPSGIQLISLEAMSAAQIVEDAKRWVLGSPHAAERGLEPGRWYFDAQRNWLSLATLFREAGLASNALWAQSRGLR
jgi:hypothetical protein